MNPLAYESLVDLLRELFKYDARAIALIERAHERAKDADWQESMGDDL
jgi:hypothetical protein